MYDPENPLFINGELAKSEHKPKVERHRNLGDSRSKIGRKRLTYQINLTIIDKENNPSKGDRPMPKCPSCHMDLMEERKHKDMRDCFYAVGKEIEQINISLFQLMDKKVFRAHDATIAEGIQDVPINSVWMQSIEKELEEIRGTLAKLPTGAGEVK